MALDRITKVNGHGVTEPLILGGDLTAQNGNFVGILTAGTFSGAFIGTVAGAASTAGYATTSFGLEGTPDIVVGTITAVDANFAGNVSIAGTLTYEDVTNIDSVGFITARSGVIVQSGGLNVTGVSTFLGNVRLDNKFETTGVGVTVIGDLSVSGDVNFTGDLYQNGTPFEAGGSLTVTEVANPGGNVNVSVGDVSNIQFNNGSGFNVIDEGSGSVLIDLGSNFNPWYVDGQQTLKASGEEPIEIIAGPGIAITTKAVASVGIGTTFSKAITFSADGDSINGIGTAVPNTNAEFYYSGPLRIDSYTLVDVPDNAESNVAYTRHTDIVVETGAELVIADGDEIITDVLDIASPSIIRPLGQAESTPSASGGGVSAALAIAYAIAL